MLSDLREQLESRKQDLIAKESESQRQYEATLVAKQLESRKQDLIAKESESQRQ